MSSCPVPCTQLLQINLQFWTKALFIHKIYLNFFIWFIWNLSLLIVYVRMKRASTILDELLIPISRRIQILLWKRWSERLCNSICLKITDNGVLMTDECTTKSQTWLSHCHTSTKIITRCSCYQDYWQVPDVGFHLPVVREENWTSEGNTAIVALCDNRLVLLHYVHPSTI